MKLNILVSGVPDVEAKRISNMYIIDDEGYLRLPDLDEVKIKASGLTGSKLAVHIANAYKERKIYTSPVFTVTSFKDTDAENAIMQARMRAAAEAARRIQIQHPVQIPSW